MALYVPAARRRRRVLIFAGVALVAGLVVGVVVGRASAPTVEDRLHSVRSNAEQTAAGLRVIALHDESSAIANQSGNGGADLVLRDTRSEMRNEFGDAPRITTAQREALLAALDELEAEPDRTSAAFGARAEAVAKQIEATFGTSN